MGRWTAAAGGACAGVFCLLLSGCAAYRGEGLTPITAWPPLPAGAERSIRLQLSGSVTLNGEEEGITAAGLGMWQKQAEMAYRGSGLFSFVTAVRSADTDLRAEIRVEQRTKYNWTVRQISGLTVWIIPNRVTDELVLKTTIRDRQGRVLVKLKKAETIATWEQLFLVFYTPFAFPPSVHRRTVFDLNRATLIEAREANIL